MIYLDNAATTQIAPEVLEAMLPYLKEEYGNAGSVHGMGRQAADAVMKARKRVADFIGAKPEQIIFTSGGTEANNLAILGCRTYLEHINKKHIITSPTEHDSVLKSIESLCCNRLSCNDEMCIKQDFYTSFLPVDSCGFISPKALDKKLKKHNDVGLVSIMCINNEIGTINDIITIGNICKEHGVLFHTDCVQTAGVIKLDVNDINCDFMSISSHKIHGPKGVGALYIRDKKYLSAIINGGGAQECGCRGGTENVAGIVGFGAACERASNNIADSQHKTVDFKKRFYNLLKRNLCEYGLDNIITVNGLEPPYTGKTLSLTFKGIDSETLVLMMDSKDVCISAGSACRNHESNPSHVLTAIGLDEDDARSTIRVSFSDFNEKYEVEQSAQILADCVKLLKSGGLNEF